MAYDEYIVTTRSGAPRQSGRRVGFRVAEHFFRRWPLYMLPFLALLAIGVVQARKATADYKSIGVLNVVSNPLLTDLNTIQGSNINSYETPAGGTARIINELLRTDKFITDVASRAGLADALEAGSITADVIRKQVYASADGDRILQVVATSPAASQALALASATIKGYTEYMLNSQVSDSTEASSFWKGQEALFQQQVDTANSQLKAYVLANPPPSNGSDRPVEQTLELQRLSNVITQAQTQVSNAQTEEQKADLTTQQLKSAAGQALQVIDAPTQPTAPESIRRKQVLVVAIYFVLGLVVLSTLLLISTFLDRTVRSSEDIATAAGLAVVATVPNVSALSKQRKRRRNDVVHREQLPASL